MKRFLITSILAAIVAAGTMLKAQGDLDEYLGLPGDNLNLYAVMKLFQESETIESFERSLNDENTRINNLDLNGDNLIDYIKVVDYVDDDVHTIVLQAVLGRTESQDVAVFTVQKFRDGSVQIQLTGDVALYGNNYIIEPIYDETPNPGYLGRTNNQNVTVVRTTYVEVAAWPLIRFIFLPNYVVWRSSYYWGYYPPYWRPWSPYYFHYYYGYHYHWYSHYYGHYHHCNYHRYAHWDNNYYYSKRVYSDNVSRRISSGNYRATYSHPEQRKEGEALYAKAHPERASGMSSGNGNGRRPVAQTTTSGKPDVATGNSTTRRSNSNVNEKSSTNPSANSNNGKSGRSNGSVNSNNRGNSSTVQNRGNGSDSNSNINNKSRSNSAGGQNNGAVPRSTTTTNNRANSGSSAGKSTVTNNSNRRSSETVSPKPATKPAKNSGSAKPSGESQKSGNSSARSSSEKSKSGSSEKKSSNSKKSESNNGKQAENSNSSRRK